MSNDPYSQCMAAAIAEIEGRTARDSGISCADNPYPADTPMHDAWRFGWNDRKRISADTCMGRTIRI